MAEEKKVYQLDMNAVKKVFDQIDADHHGKIYDEDLFRMMSALGLPTTQSIVSKMFHEMSLSNHFVVTLADFAEFCRRKVELDATGVRELDLRNWFEMFDQDKNGVISAAELLLVRHRLGMGGSVEECSRMIQTFDTDGDGYVSLDEFRIMVIFLLLE